MAAAQCKTCAAHKQTIEALQMVIQAQNQTMKLLAEQRAPSTGAHESGPPSEGTMLHQLQALGLTDAPVEEHVPDHMPRKWLTEDEEVVTALRQEDWIDDVEYEKRMAALQAANPPVVSVIR